MEGCKAFILMPFSESLSEVYDFLIKGALTDAGYQVKRADDIKSQSNILEDIVKGIMESDLIVADLTESNPNVYYELGIAHSFQKKVVLITQEIDELPFDLRSYRVIPYSTHFSRMNTAKKELEVIAKEASEGKIPFGNPIKDYGLHSGDNKTLFDNHELTKNDDLGALDHQVEIEEGFEVITGIVELVGTKLADELVPAVNATTNDLKTKKDLSAKKKRRVIKQLAEHLDGFATFLKPKNSAYRTALINTESSLEYILSNADESKEDVEGFIEGFESMKNGAQDGREGFMSMLEVLKDLPSLEKNFNRANKYMQDEIQLLIENIDKTLSMASRAVMLGHSLLKRVSE
ncbi:MAG: hypothetical protein GXO85_09865 [Chlorobi bacterium]|nr:hypothetical protein [Chlorobiota bacterium]